MQVSEKYKVKSTEQLRELVRYATPGQDMNHLDVSELESLDKVFSDIVFYGKVDQWDVRRIRSINCMCQGGVFLADISNWQTYSLEFANYAFANSLFNCDIGNWNVCKLKYAESMFFASTFNRNLSKWNVPYLKDATLMFNKTLYTHDTSHLNIQEHKNKYSTSLGIPFNQRQANEYIRSIINDEFNGLLEISKGFGTNQEVNELYERLLDRFDNFEYYGYKVIVRGTIISRAGQHWLIPRIYTALNSTKVLRIA